MFYSPVTAASPEYKAEIRFTSGQGRLVRRCRPPEPLKIKNSTPSTSCLADGVLSSFMRSSGFVQIDAFVVFHSFNTDTRRICIHIQFDA